MRKEQTICRTCQAIFEATVVELSRGRTRCPVCSELEVMRGRLGMLRGWPMGKREFWEEMAKRIAAYGSRTGLTVELILVGDTEGATGCENRSERD